MNHSPSHIFLQQFSWGLWDLSSLQNPSHYLPSAMWTPLPQRISTDCVRTLLEKKQLHDCNVQKASELPLSLSRVNHSDSSSRSLAGLCSHCPNDDFFVLCTDVFSNIIIRNILCTNSSAFFQVDQISRDLSECYIKNNNNPKVKPTSGRLKLSLSWWASIPCHTVHCLTYDHSSFSRSFPSSLLLFSAE